ncbi:retrovirus-related pol polyprotein from transposon TNT 1-94, partial [Tanacetum coccineum]
MDLFRPVTPRYINHEKYTLVIVVEYSWYTWVYFLKKKSQALETIMSFIKRVENRNDIKVKQLRTNNGTEFRNNILVNFCDEKGFLKNFPLIEAARIMLLGFVFSKQYWTEAVATTSTENGVNPPALNLTHNSNFSLLSVLGIEILTGPNYMDWMLNLRFILRYENKEYVLDEQIPTIDDDS